MNNAKLALGCAALAFSFGVSAQGIKLPKTLTFTAYETGSSGFNIAVAVGKAMKDKHGADLRVLPAGNDVARLAPMRGGRAQASAMGIGVYFAQEGVLEFASKIWGPQPLGLILASTSCNAIALGVAKDTGVKEVKDLKGKRIGMVVGSPALNTGALAVLAFGGLTKNDVKLVEFSSYGAMWKGILNNEADAAIASTISGQPREVEASPRGLFFPPHPPGDKAAWDRLAKVGPYMGPHRATCGIGISKEKPLDSTGYPYPIFVAYHEQSADLVYNITKSMIVDYETYKGSAPGADGLEVSRQKLEWVLPYHAGTVKALKEAGAWKPEHDKHQAALLKRQAALTAAWTAFRASGPSEEAEAFRKSWMAARAAALQKAGMNAIFE